jgi:hypothetical protein
VKEEGTGPHHLLDLARGLLRRADPATAGLWPRASALLACSALEAGVLGLWERRKLDLGACPMRAQLICLRTYLGDPDLASRAGHAGSALSRACHHHAYELAPTAVELESWLAVVGEFLRTTGSTPDPPVRSAASASPPA